MALPAKNDYCGLGDVAGLAINDANDNASATYIEKQGQNGAIVATEMFGERRAPTNSYRLNADVSLSSISLGSVKEIGNHNYALTQFSVTTGGGQPPQVSAACQQIEDNPAYNPCTFALPSFTLKKWFHAQIMSGATVTGSKCEVTATTLTASCEVPLAENDGVIIASDAVNGKIEEQLTILQYGDAAPQVTEPNGWIISVPLSCSRPDSDFPTWTVTLSKALEKTEHSS